MKKDTITIEERLDFENKEIFEFHGIDLVIEKEKENLPLVLESVREFIKKYE